MPKARRTFLAAKASGAKDELDQMLPVMMSQARNADEAAFIRSLVVEVEAAPQPPPAQPAETTKPTSSPAL